MSRWELAETATTTLVRSLPTRAAATTFVAALLTLFGFDLFFDGGLPRLLAMALTAVVSPALVTLAPTPCAERARIRTAVLERRAAQPAFLPGRDPNAAGRARPRAPGSGPADR